MSLHIVNKMTETSTLEEKEKKIIFSCASVFPFTLFRDHIVVDENKVDIIYHEFFLSSSVFTILLEDIRSVKVNVGPFFASIDFEVVGYEKNPHPVDYIGRNDGLLARRIIMGLSMLKRKETDLSKLSVSEIREQAETLGAAQD